MNASSDGDRVGHGRPPRDTRWKKGQRGNQRLRKTKRPESTLSIIDRMLLAPVEITERGETKKLPALAVITLQLVQKAMAGNGRARRALLKYQEFANQNSETKIEVTFAESDYTIAFANQNLNGGHE